MAILKVDTISGIGTEGPVFEGDIEFTSQNFLTLPKGDTTQRGRGRGVSFGGDNNTTSILFVDIQSQGTLQMYGAQASCQSASSRYGQRGTSQEAPITPED